MKDDSIIIEAVSDWPREQIVALYRAGNWWKEHYDPEGLDALISGSFIFVIAVDASAGMAVGMGRAISDSVSDAWLQDIVVLDDYRKRGIGRAIIEKLLELCKKNDLTWIGLVSEPGTGVLYESLGFETLPGEPMLYRGDTNVRD